MGCSHSDLPQRRLVVTAPSPYSEKAFDVLETDRQPRSRSSSPAKRSRVSFLDELEGDYLEDDDGTRRGDGPGKWSHAGSSPSRRGVGESPYGKSILQRGHASPAKQGIPPCSSSDATAQAGDGGSSSSSSGERRRNFTWRASRLPGQGASTGNESAGGSVSSTGGRGPVGGGNSKRQHKAMPTVDQIYPPPLRPRTYKQQKSSGELSVDGAGASLSTASTPLYPQCGKAFTPGGFSDASNSYEEHLLYINQPGVAGNFAYNNKPSSYPANGAKNHAADYSANSAETSVSTRNLYTSGLEDVELENDDFTILDRRIPRVSVQDQCSEFELLMATDFSRVFRCVWRNNGNKNDIAAAKAASRAVAPTHATNLASYRSGTTNVTNQRTGRTRSEMTCATMGSTVYDARSARDSGTHRSTATFQTDNYTARTSSTLYDELNRSITRQSFFTKKYQETQEKWWEGVPMKGINNGRFFALKEVSKRSPHREAFTKEVQMLAHLEHRSILRFFGVYLEDPFSLYFLSELCKMDSQTYTEELAKKCVQQEDITFFSRPFGINCDVTDPVYRVTTVDGQAERLGVRPRWALRRHPETGEGLHRSEIIHILKDYPLPVTVTFDNEDEWNQRLLVLVREFLSVLRYLHEDKRIVHGDIKPGNVLIDMKNKLKLCDFGSAIQVASSGFLQTCTCGTEGYRAPEITDAGTMGYDGFRADIYSVGKTLELWTKNPEAKVQWDYSVNPAIRWMISEAAQEQPLLRPKIGYMLSSIFEDLPFHT
ncbi:unnamed protein product [Amoebophrya sp. A25]|nr:unnamed protein product [Amoebophrya sp. A25]|eukprot:GSA25T00005217001.1